MKNSPTEDFPASLSLSRSSGKRTAPLKDVGNSKQFASPVKEREYIE